MTAVSSRPPLSLDPLIAQAKRRARQRGVIVVVLCVLLLGGAAGGLTLALRDLASSRGNHTYVTAFKGVGVYITAVSPVAIPNWRRTYPGYHVSGPQACSWTKHVQGLQGPSRALNGKTVTLTVYGSSAAVPGGCSVWKSMIFPPAARN